MLYFGKRTTRIGGLIYQVRRPDTENVIYVGQAKIFSHRILTHFNGERCNVELHKDLSAILLSGKWPVFEVLEITSVFMLNVRETFWIIEKSKYHKLHNILGVKRRPKTEEMSEEHRNYIFDFQEHREAIQSPLRQLAYAHYKDGTCGKHRGISGYVEDKAVQAVTEFKERLDFNDWVYGTGIYEYGAP